MRLVPPCAPIATRRHGIRTQNAARYKSYLGQRGFAAPGRRFSMSVTWDPSYDTGNIAIDQQHRALLGIVDELDSAETASRKPRDVILQVLDHVMDFTITHFVMEEALMVEVGYPAPAREEMITQHREFTSYARLRVLEFRHNELVSFLPLQAFLAGWLTVHEFGLDKLLAHFIQEQAAAHPEAGAEAS